MKFKDLDENQITLAKEIYTNKEIPWDQRMTQLMGLFGRSERTVRRWCSNKLGFKERIEPDPEVLTLAKSKIHNKSKKRFLITSAQNATPVHQGFFNNLKAYAEFIDAEILVIPYRYHNPTSIWSDKDKRDDWWPNEVSEYLTLNRHNLNDRVAVLSDVKIQPTASGPLNGLEGMTGDHCSVVGHPRMELKCVPVLDINKPKIMFTTGTCSKKNFLESKAGKKAEFHSSIGFAIIEIKDNDTFFFRQVSANDDGEFIDLFYALKDGIVTKETEVEACIMGDIHVANVNPEITNITLNDLFKRLRPKKVCLHDIIDFGSISHHNRKDPFKLYEQEMNGSNSMTKEIDDMVLWLKPLEEYNVYVVKGNHDVHGDIFLKENDWRKLTTLKNAIPYMEYGLAVLQGKAPNGIIPYVINKVYPKFKCLTFDDSLIIKGYQCGAHGHLGGNGSRGSLSQFSRLSTKSVTGHSHAIGRIGGAVSVGTSTHLKVGYNVGYSAWINGHGIINRLGKFQHVVFFHTKDGVEYTTFD